MARCKPDKIVSSDFDDHPTTGKVKMLDTGKLQQTPPEDLVGKITPLGEGPLPDFSGDKEAVTQYCVGCADAAQLLTDTEKVLKTLLENISADKNPITHQVMSILAGRIRAFFGETK